MTYYFPYAPGKLEPLAMHGDLFVTVIEAINVHGADAGGKSSDPYVKVQPRAQKEQKTKVIKKNLSPVWNETLKWKGIVIRPGQSIRFEVYDHDTFRWLCLVPKKRGEKARGQLHVRISFLTGDRPAPPAPPPAITPPPRQACDEPLFQAPPPAPVQAEPPAPVHVIPTDQEEANYDKDEPSATAAEPLVAVPDTRAWDTSPEAPSSDSDPAAAQAGQVASTSSVAAQPSSVESSQVSASSGTLSGTSEKADASGASQAVHASAASEVKSPPPPPPATLEIWQIDKGKLSAVPKEEYGKFYNGDCYLILRTTYRPQPVYDIHMWIGHNSTPDEQEVVQKKSGELEKAVGGTANLHQEYEGRESQLFLSYFPNGIQYLEGGIDTGYGVYNGQKVRLMHIKGYKDIRVRQVPLTYKSLNSGDSFILDAGTKIWQWNGKTCNHLERRRGTEILLSFVNERCGRVQTINIALLTVAADEGEEDEEFWAVIGGKGPIASARAGGEDEVEQKARHEHKLFRLIDNGGKLEYQEVARGTNVKRRLLVPEGVFILDVEVEIFVWIGKKAPPQAKTNALKYAGEYLNRNQRPAYTPVNRLIQGGESDYFKAAFHF